MFDTFLVTRKFRIYNLTQSASQPEQTFQLFPKPVVPLTPQKQAKQEVEEVAVSFTFGDGKGWNRFTIFFVTDSGNIYALCPVVPYNMYNSCY